MLSTSGGIPSRIGGKMRCKSGLVIAATAALLSCEVKEPYGGQDDRVQVSILNVGTESVSVHAEGQFSDQTGWRSYLSVTEPRDLLVSPNRTTEFSFRRSHFSWLRVRVTRASDGQEVFEGAWDRSYLDESKDRVGITVNP